MTPAAKHIYLFLALAFLAVGHEACAGGETSIGAASKPAPKEIPLAGKVLETMDGGGYTYILLKNGNEKIWVAAPLMKVVVGQDLALVPGFEMKNFTSKGLNRKFDRVVFTAGVVDNKGIQLSPAAIKMAHKGVPVEAPKAQAAQAPAAKVGKPAVKSIGRIPRAQGPNSYTIAELYAKKTKLEKKPIAVRGRVVKVSPSILKRNWIHIEDGSGTQGKKNNNLVITSKDLPKEGDVVTARGTLYNNMDFGSGYKYSLLIEGARFKQR